MKEKILNELKSIFWTSIYFFSWFGGLMIFKVLLLREYRIEIYGISMVVIGALVVAKVVLILEYVPMPFTKSKPAYVDILFRTFLYLAGVFIVMVVEKSIEARHDDGGILNAFKNLKMNADKFHIWVNTLCVFGALVFFNIWTVVKKHFGKGIFRKLMINPVPLTAEQVSEKMNFNLENHKM